MTQKPVRTFFSAFTLFAGLTGVALTGIAPAAQAASVKQPFIRVAGDCAAIGQQVAAAQGGTLTKATPAVQNGKPVCIVVVLVPGRDGERPRRVEVAVPAK